MKKYNDLVLKKMIFLYGQDATKKYKERIRNLIIIPVLAIIVGIILSAFGINSKTAAAVSAGMCVVIVFFIERNIFVNAKKKCNRMRMELAEVLDRIALLLEAGTSLWNAIVTVSSASNGGSGTLIEELGRTVASFYDSNGYIYDPETAFESLAERCEDPYISTFVSLVIQNARKGSSELADLMRMQAINARNERRILAKQLSDEATTLMLFPSSLILIAILVIAAAPAILQLI